jgi:hypothetical protein
MKTLNFKALLTATVATVSTVVVAGQPVLAGGFKTLNTDWNIVQDLDVNGGLALDGTTGNSIGLNSDYQMFGMAAKVEDGQAYFAIHGNLAPGGKNGVGYGDLFFNFSDKSFKDASAAEELFAVRFAPNDAGDGTTQNGLYQNVSAKSVTSTNSGHAGFQAYENYVANRGGAVGFGDLTPDEAQEYLTAFNGGYQDGGHSIQNVIKTGTKVADDGFALLSATELAGLDFGTGGSDFNKEKTFGFKFDAAKLPTGDALITLLHECINDGMAMKAEFVPPPVEAPEPTSIVSLGLIGLALAGSKLRKQDS